MIGQWYGEKTLSQHGDDIMVLNIFRLIENYNPTYLDIGAHHPWNISNTALLYEKGCRGINVEANPNLMEPFQYYRPEDKNINVGVAGKKGKLPFYMIDNCSGRNTFSKASAEQFVREYPQHTIQEVREIEVVTINELLDDDKFPNFLTIDVEGMDFEILKAADFRRSRPDVICVEAWHDVSSPIKNLLKRENYFVYCRMGWNLFFVQEKYYDKLY